METEVKRIKKTGSNGTETYFTNDHKSFTVTIGPNRILTIFSDNETTAKKWITQVQKAYRNKKKKTQPLIVGVQVSRELNYTKKGVENNPYEYLTLCIGSQCLIYELPDLRYRTSRGYSGYKLPQVLKDLFTDTNVIFVGMDINVVSEKLQEDHDLKMSKKVEIRDLAKKVITSGGGYVKKIIEKEFDLKRNKKVKVVGVVDLGRSFVLGMRGLLQGKNVDELSEILLGREKRILMRNEVEFNSVWDRFEDRDAGITSKHAMDLTVDAWVFHQVGMEYLDIVLKCC